MAFKIHSFLLALLFTLCILLSVANEAAAGRTVPKDSKEEADVKQPEWLIGHHEGTVLIPGLGRALLPPHGHKGHLYGHDHLHYNPVTGTYGGPRDFPVFGGGGAPHTYVPGADDTFIPNPGFEVPIPGTGPRPPVTGNPP